jgi:hypothetical protein
MRRAESGVPSCTFGGLQAQMATLYGTDSHNGPRRFVNWRNIPIALIDPVPNCSAIESPDARSAETRSRKSERFALDALSALWTRDRAGGTAPRRLRASTMPKVQAGIHSGQAERLSDTLIPVELGITGLT